MTSSIRVLIADDHAILRKGIRALLSTEPDMQVVGESSDGLQTVAQARALRPDVILMDLVMPNMDGIEATRRITAEQPGVRILVLTSFAADDKVFPAIKAGALGYILKDSGPAELVQAIHQVRQGQPSLEPAIALKMLHELSHPPQQPPTYSRSAQRARAGGVALAGPGEKQPRDRRPVGHHRVDGAHSREQRPGQAAPGQPYPSRALCPQGGAGLSR